MTTRGFTLLETIMYIALFSLLMTGVLVTVYELLAGGTHNRASVQVQEEGTFVNRKISWALSGATSVEVPDSKTLKINTRPDFAQTPIQITESAGQILLSRGGAAPVPLTTSELEVTNTQITMVPEQGGVPASIRVLYEIEGTPFVFQSYLHF